LSKTNHYSEGIHWYDPQGIGNFQASAISRLGANDFASRPTGTATFAGKVMTGKQ